MITIKQRTTVKLMFSFLALLIATVTSSVNAQGTGNISKTEKKETPSAIGSKNSEQELINLSKQKWQWMSEHQVDSLDALFHEKAVFVHMGATMSKKQELDVIRSGTIQYKNAEIQEVSVQIIDQTAILLNKIRLVAIVGGNEVINPFVVTEVYVQQSGTWKLASLSFTRLLTQ
jgi:4-carboxymuconolactone decarboxylase